ncbi:MAG: four helix bundle protein [Planctomycetes bacterium]|nr:four helix bundle protein [Planctomycetota bacterium]
MFDALEVSLDVVASLRAPLQVLRTKDGDLYRQVRRAGSSIPLNIAEGGRRVGKDRKHLLARRARQRRRGPRRVARPSRGATSTKRGSCDPSRCSIA